MVRLCVGLAPLVLLILSLISGGRTESNEWPKDVVTIEVRCPPVEDNFFKCLPNWNYAPEEERVDIDWENDEERLDRIEEFINNINNRADVITAKTYGHDASKYPGADIYKDALVFYGITSDRISIDNFLFASYFLDYYASNTYVVTKRDGQQPVVGFSGGIFAPNSQDTDDENVQSYYGKDFMEAMRKATVQYKIYIDGNEDKYYYAIGYMGTFSVPYFFSPVETSHLGFFSFSYNMDYKWATGDKGTLNDFAELMFSSQDVFLPGVFMSRFLAPTSIFGDVVEVSKIDRTRFEYMFNNTYGLINGDDSTTSKDRYTHVKGLNSNFCRSLGRNNKGDADVTPDDPKEDYHYDYVPPIGDDTICNERGLPSYYFMTYDFTKTLPHLFSTKYQLWVDASCQYRTNLDGKGLPKTTETNVSYGQTTDSNPDSGNKDLPNKTTFIMNGNDFFGLHLVQDMKDTGNPSSYHPNNSTDVDKFYYYYSLNNNTIENIYLDKLSMCNTAISDNYVLYDMKDYANVYGSIGGITDASFGYESVYNSMKTYPTKTNYTAVVTAASFLEVSEGEEESIEIKTQLQKCVNVFLDTNGQEVSACNDVTSTWNWTVFAISLVGLLAVIGLWVWGGLYNKNFNKQPPSYYNRLVEYEPEWKRLDAIEKQKKKTGKIAEDTGANGRDEEIED